MSLNKNVFYFVSRFISVVSFKHSACFYFDIVKSFQNKTKECHHLITVVYLDGRYAGIFLFCRSLSVPAGRFLSLPTALFLSLLLPLLLVSSCPCQTLSVLVHSFLPRLACTCLCWSLPVLVGLLLSRLVPLLVPSPCPHSYHSVPDCLYLFLPLSSCPLPVLVTFYVYVLFTSFFPLRSFPVPVHFCPCLLVFSCPCGSPLVSTCFQPSYPSFLSLLVS